MVLPDWDQTQKGYIFRYIVTKTWHLKVTASHSNSIELAPLFAKHDAPFLSHSVNWCSCINDLISWGGKFNFRMGHLTLLQYCLHSLGKHFMHAYSIHHESLAHHVIKRASIMAELVLDPAIRLWVILPIVMITFLVGIIRHYLSMLLQSKKELDLLQVSDR